MIGWQYTRKLVKAYSTDSRCSDVDGPHSFLVAVGIVATAATSR